MIIFLDFDGVIAPLDCYDGDDLWQWFKNSDVSAIASVFDADCIAALCLLQRNLNAKIVIHSSWVQVFDHDLIVDVMEAAGITNLSCPACAEWEFSGNRWEAIDNYILFNDIEEYVIIDDEDWCAYGDIDENRIIQTNAKTGLTLNDVRTALDRFKK